MVTCNHTTGRPTSVARVAGESTAPPPRASTPGASSSSAVVDSSKARKTGSPSSAKISATLLPTRDSMTASTSAKGTPHRCASRAPTVDLPEPGAPTSTRAAVTASSPGRQRQAAGGDAVEEGAPVPAGLGDRVATELLDGRVGQHERGHGLGHDAGGGHGADVGTLVVRDGRLAGGGVDGAQRARDRGDRLHGGAHAQDLARAHAA